MTKLYLVILKNKDESIHSYNVTDISGRIIAKPKYINQIHAYIAKVLGKDTQRTTKHIQLITKRQYA